MSHLIHFYFESVMYLRTINKNRIFIQYKRCLKSSKLVQSKNVSSFVCLRFGRVSQLITALSE